MQTFQKTPVEELPKDMELEEFLASGKPNDWIFSHLLTTKK
ncbi:MAG: hypothetical protein WKI49_05465 [Aquificaceae bacterium]